MNVLIFYGLAIASGIIGGFSTKTSFRMSMGMASGIAIMVLSIVAGMRFALLHSLGVLAFGAMFYLILMVIFVGAKAKEEEVEANKPKEYQFKANQSRSKKKKKR